jgi:branched-subunit amino acid transport protein
MLALSGIGWGVWTGRRACDLSMVAAVGAFCVHAYAALGAQVHENHLFAAMPLLVVAAAARRRFVPILAGVTMFLTLGMLFYIFGDQEGPVVLSRSLTFVDTTFLLALFNCGLFIWHGAVLRWEARA